MSIIMPGDAHVLITYGFKQTGESPTRFSKQLGHRRFIIKYDRVKGWIMKVIISHLNYVEEFQSSKLADVLRKYEELEKKR